MNELDPSMSGAAGHESPEGPDPVGEDVAPENARHQVMWDRLRRWTLRAIAVVGAFLLLMFLLTGTAAWYTSRPQFCNSCHIMGPYYKSWETSSHADVSCVKCHFPPGVGEKVRGKMLGLVQLAKYVTASAGPRPAAEIPNSSCLRSGCHETRLLSGRVDFHGIPFDHAPHIGELRRGKELRCTSCHSQIVQGDHMKVTPSTCFLCHFKDGFFNEGLGACTRCHQIPDGSFDLGGGVEFSHDLAYEKGVDCASCHRDLIRGNGEVPRERCTVCHNREDDLQRLDDAVFLHSMHVTQHKIDCLSCHLAIHHSLNPHEIENAASDCDSCHPDHHQEQVRMLQGTGGKLVPTHRSGMTAARIACPTCHINREISATGTVLMKSSIETCATCHDAEEIDDLQVYHDQLQDVVSQFEADLQRVQGALESADLPADRETELTQRLNDIAHDVAFLRTGNDIHNSHYANTLTAAVAQQMKDVCDKLGIDPPDVSMPENPFAAEPAREDSATETPAQEEPVTEEPVTEEPAAKEPAANEAAVEMSAEEKPATKEPVAEPAAEEKRAEEKPAPKKPTAEKPVTVKPTGERPTSENPQDPQNEGS